MSGVPGDGDVGSNIFAVAATDTQGRTSNAALNIAVLNTFTGELGLTDFAALAARWLETGCTDTPACGGADLSGDNAVNIDDIADFGSMWLIQRSYGGLVSTWPFDADASDSAGAHDGTLVNGASINTTDAVIGVGALELDGVDIIKSPAIEDRRCVGLWQGTEPGRSSGPDE